MVFKKKALPVTRINSEWDKDQEMEDESMLPEVPEPIAPRQQTPTRQNPSQSKKEDSPSVSEYLDVVEGNLIRSLNALREFRAEFKI